MIRLIGLDYAFGLNIVIGKCTTCYELRCGKLSQPLILSCTCGSTEFEKPPLYFLTNTTPTMIVFKFTNHNTDKSFVGTIITPEEKNPESKILPEIKYIRDFRTFKISKQLKKDLADDIENLEWEILSTPKTLLSAMIDEKLYISKYDTLHPNGYNTCSIIETLIKKTRKNATNN